MVFFHQIIIGFFIIRIERNAIHRADLHALWRIKMSDALGAFIRVDDLNFVALRNRFVRAFGQAHITVDALVGNRDGHS